MNGAQLLQSAGIGTVPTVWSIVGQRDFNGDGKADWLWRDTSGNVAMWFFNGAQVTQSAGVGTVPTVWSIVGTGDFNGGGKGLRLSSSLSRTPDGKRLKIDARIM
jgi:hypothetical protein